MKTEILIDFHIYIKVPLRNLNFCPEFFGHAGKRPSKKAKVNFRIHGVINWEQIIRISAQYLKK